MKVVSVVGARPQFIKAAPVSRRLRVRHHEILVHTGQHYDDAMSAVFFRDLDLPVSDRDLEVGSGTHGEQTAEMLRRLEPILINEAPEVVLVYGDTNSTLAGAVAAAKIAYAGGTRPLLAHVEAGLRSFNPSMPEERNRIVADHLADLLLAPTPAAMENLAREGLAERSTMVGDVMVDAFESASARAQGALPPLAAQLPGYLLLTLHRPANVDDPVRLGRWLSALDGIAPVIFPVHPRTREMLDRAAVPAPGNVVLIEPVGHLAMVALERAATLVLTDSGGVQKEAYLAGVPCVTLRGETEWIETLEAGWNRLCPNPDDLPSAMAAARGSVHPDRRPALFGDGHAADRVVAAIEGLVEGRPAALVAS